MADLIKRNYLPGPRPERDNWLTGTYSIGFNQYKNLFGITPAQDQTVQDAVAMALYTQARKLAIQSFGKSETVYSNGLDTSKGGGADTAEPEFVSPVRPTLLQPVPPEGYFVFIAEMNDAQIIGKPAFDATIETAMGLTPIAGHDDSDAAPKAPTLEAHDGGLVHLKAIMHGHRSMGVEMKRSSEPDVVTTTTTQYPEWDDARPNVVASQSESRSYRVRYELSQGVYSDYSDWVSVATKP